MELLKPSRIQDEPFRFQINGSEYTIKETCQEEIKRHIKNDEDIDFPHFKKGTMYKGMKLDKRYTLKELGLD